MELRTSLRVLRARWKFAVGALIACTTAAAAIAWARTPMYTANTQLFVSAGGAGATYQGALFSEQRVLSYVQMVTSPPVLEAVIRQLGLQENSRQLASEIQATVPTGTVLLSVNVQDRSATRAAAIAHSLAAQFAAFVAQLEKVPGAPGSRATVVTTSPAQVPPSPSSPRKAVYLAIGLLLGLVVGIGGAFLREALDRRVRTEEDASKAAGAPVLVNISARDRTQSRSLVMAEEPLSPLAEEYRRLRANLGALVEDQQVRALLVSSARGGERTAIVVANLGIAFAQAGHRAVVIDANLREPELAAILGVRASPGLTDVLRNDLPVSSALQTWPGDSALTILAAGPAPANPSELLASPRAVGLVAELKDRFDLVVVDAPALLDVADAAVISRATSGALVVATSGATRSEDLAAAAGALRAVDVRTLGVVLNRRSKGRRSSWAAPRHHGESGEGTLSPLEGEHVSAG